MPFCSFQHFFQLVCAEAFHSKSTAFANVVSDASMYLCVVWIDLCEANSAITRTLTPLFAKFVMNERLPLWLLAPLMPLRSYKRFISCVSALVLNRLLFCVLNRKVRCKTLVLLCRYRLSADFARFPTNTRLTSLFCLRSIQIQQISYFAIFIYYIANTQIG